MTEIDLSAGTIDYVDSRGDGPPLVFLHGLMMDSTLWAQPIAELATDYRCIAPTLPMGAHRHPVRSDSDLSLPGLAGIVTELLERLELSDVTLVGVDTGGALAQLLMGEGDHGISQVVLMACEAFDNLPPGTTGRTLAAAGKLSPALFGLFMQQLRLRIVRRSPMAFGALTKRGDAVTRDWIRPLLAERDVRRDTVRMLRAVFADRHVLLAAAERLPQFQGRVLIVWPTEDRVMPIEHGRRLHELLPHSELVEIDDSYTLVPLDQPRRLVDLTRSFLPRNSPSR